MVHDGLETLGPYRADLAKKTFVLRVVFLNDGCTNQDRMSCKWLETVLAEIQAQIIMLPLSCFTDGIRLLCWNVVFIFSPNVTHLTISHPHHFPRRVLAYPCDLQMISDFSFLTYSISPDDALLNINVNQKWPFVA